MERLLALLLLCFHMKRVGFVRLKFMHEHWNENTQIPSWSYHGGSGSIVLIGTINGHVFTGFGQGHLGQCPLRI